MDTTKPKENLESVMVNKLSEGEVEKPLTVEFKVPAQHFTDAIPIGNGRLGAMVWGGVQSETLNLNEETLWTGTPGDYTNPETPKALAAVRKLVDDGRYVEASNEAVKLFDNSPNAYQPLGHLKLEFDDSHSSYCQESYSKELDLYTATAKIKYSVDDIEYTREHFVSCPDQVIVTKISANKPGSLSFTVYLDSLLHHTYRVNSSNGEKYQIIMEGSCPGGHANITNENPKGIQFCATLNLLKNDDIGSVKISEKNKLRIEGSNCVVLYMVASSSFDGPFTKPSESKRDPNLECVKYLNSIESHSYEELYERHLNDYQPLFRRVSLELSKRSEKNGDVAKISTAERVEVFQKDEDPSLVELLFQFGRYLLISSSRPGTQVSNLQGIWSWKTEPTWHCAPTLNINQEMNYWPSLSCNLQECHEPLFDYMSSLAISGSKTARVNYEASGWVAHHASDIWAKTSQDKYDAVWSMWPMGGAWLCTHLWEHYMFTLDKDFLRNKAYPLLEGCTLFLLDWLIEGQGGYLETNPSTSPEHNFITPDGNEASVSYSSTMDMSIIREVFVDIVSAAKVLRKSEDDLIGRVRKAHARLLPTKIARDGYIMEWAQDFQDPAEHHRHVSHLFGLFPGHMITPEDTPDLCKAAVNTLIKRGVEGPGWSTAWKTALWARLRDSESAYKMVKHLFHLAAPENNANEELVGISGLYTNLFTSHPPFQIDANFGFSAAVAEMLVQSTIKDLILLPALPRDKWPNGCVKGLKARGGVTVNIWWNEGDLLEAALWSNNSNSVTKRLHYKETTVDATMSGDRVYIFNKQLKFVKMDTL